MLLDGVKIKSTKINKLGNIRKERGGKKNMSLYEYIILIIQYNFYLMLGILVSAIIYAPAVFCLFKARNLTNSLVLKVIKKIKRR